MNHHYGMDNVTSMFVKIIRRLLFADKDLPKRYVVRVPIIH